MPIAPDLRGCALDGRYELHAPIGEGAFGRVYRGRDRRLDRDVAVKVIKPWWAEDPAWVAVFERETRMLARLSAPGIVQIHDVGHAPEGLYYVSELIEGEDLAQRLAAAGRPTAREARTIALGLCRGLAAAHAKGVVHRDVKPANVLLSTDGRVTVADFGVARLAEATSHGTAPSIAVGTPKYMAPEQGRGADATPRTDVYGVGVVLYEMLAGRPPFQADSPVALALAHLQDPPPPLPRDVPSELARVVARALAKDPADRYADAGEMAAALGSAAAVPPPRRSRDPHVAGGPAPRSEMVVAATLPSAGRAPRVTHHPAARRRTIALLTGAGALLGGLAAAALTGAFSGGGGARTAAQRAPVAVPLVVRENQTDATATLRRLGLRVSAVAVPAPGIAPGTVTDQRPAGGRTAPPGSTVRLSVSEVPRWRALTSFSGAQSVAFRIRGARWRLVSSVAHARHCTLVVFCSGSSVSVTRPGSDAAIEHFGIGDGSGQERVFTTGPGTYQVRFHPGSGDTRWTIRIEDDY